MSTATAPSATRLMTAEEFFAWANRPENADRHCELEDGRVIDMPPPGHEHGLIASWIAHLLWTYCIVRGGGHVTSNDTGIRVRPNSIQGADVMLFDSPPPRNPVPGYPTEIPALVVEVYSPTDRPGRLNRRIGRYHAHGIPLVWVVYPEEFQVDVFRANQAVQSFGLGDTLQGFAELPGFSTTVAGLFTLPGQQPPTAAP